MGAYFHTISSMFKKNDAAQERFLCELDFIPAQGFLEFNFVHPSLRGHIGILRFLSLNMLQFQSKSTSNEAMQAKLKRMNDYIQIYLRLEKRLIQSGSPFSHISRAILVREF